MAEKNTARLYLTLADQKTKKPSNFNEWLRRLRGDARNILWLHGDFALLEDSALPADHTLVKKLKYTLTLLANPTVQENISQSYKLQLNANEVLAQMTARREEVWAFVTARVSTPSMDKLERLHSEELLALQSTQDVPGLIKLLCSTHMLKHAHSAGQNRLAILGNLLEIKQAHDEEISSFCIRLEDLLNLYVWQLPSEERTRYLEAEDTVLLVIASFNVKMTRWKSEVTASPLVPSNAAAYIQHAITWYTDALPNALAMGYQYPGQEYVRPGRQDAIVSAAVIDTACRFCKMQGHFEAHCWQKHPHLKPTSNSKTPAKVAKPQGHTRGEQKIKHSVSRENGRTKMTVPPAKGTGGRGALTRSGDRKGDTVVRNACLFCIEKGVPVAKIQHLLADCKSYQRFQDKTKTKSKVLLSVDADSDSDSDFAFCAACEDDSDCDSCPEIIDDADSDSDCDLTLFDDAESDSDADTAEANLCAAVDESAVRAANLQAECRRLYDDDSWRQLCVLPELTPGQKFTRDAAIFEFEERGRSQWDPRDRNDPERILRSARHAESQLQHGRDHLRLKCLARQQEFHAASVERRRQRMLSISLLAESDDENTEFRSIYDTEEIVPTSMNPLKSVVMPLLSQSTKPARHVCGANAVPSLDRLLRPLTRPVVLADLLVTLSCPVESFVAVDIVPAYLSGPSPDRPRPFAPVDFDPDGHPYSDSDDDSSYGCTDSASENSDTFIGMADDSTSSPTTTLPGRSRNSEATWTCDRCTLENTMKVLACAACRTPGRLSSTRVKPQPAVRPKADRQSPLSDHFRSPTDVGGARQANADTVRTPRLPMPDVRGALSGHHNTIRPAQFDEETGCVTIDFLHRQLPAGSITIDYMTDIFRQLRVNPTDAAHVLHVERLYRYARELRDFFDASLTVTTAGNFHVHRVLPPTTLVPPAAALDIAMSTDNPDDDADSTAETEYQDALIYMAKDASDAEQLVSLDTGAGKHIFDAELLRYASSYESCNRKFNGISGSVYATSVGSVGPFTKVYFAATGRSLLSLSTLEKSGATVTHSAGRLTINMQRAPDGLYVIPFQLQNDGLYSITVNELLQACTHPSYRPAETVYAALAGFTSEEIRRAHLARAFHEALGHTGRNQELEHLRRGSFSNAQVTAADLILSDKVLGDCQVCHESKVYRLNRVRPSALVATTVIGHTMLVDIMFLKHAGRTTPIWIFVDQATLKVIVSSPQSGATRDATTFLNALTAVNAYYLKHNHSRVRRILSDGEKSILKHESLLNSQGIELFTQARGRHEHVPERMIGVCKQTLRSILRGLPYVFSPTWLPFLLSEMSLLMSLRSNQLTRGVPIIEVIEGRRIDLSRIAIKFGSFAYAPTPTVKPSLEEFRNEPVIVLGRRLHGASSFTCLLLTNFEIVKRYNVQATAIPPEYVKLINTHSDESLQHVDFVDAMFLGSNDYDAYADDDQFNAANFDAAPPPSTEASVRPVPSLEMPARASSPELSSLISRPPLVPAPVSYRDALAPRAPLPPPAPADVPTVTLDPIVSVLPPAAPVAPPKPVRIKPPPKPLPALSMNLRSRTTPANLASDMLDEKDTSPVLTAINAFAALANSNLSIKKAKKIDVVLTDAALKKEMQQMLDKDIFSPILRHTLTSDQHRKTIRSHTFFKHKGDKMKGRLVAGGQDVAKDELGDISSPTGKHEAIMLLLALAAAYNFEVTALDIVAAYLNTRLPANQQIPMRLGPDEAAVLVALKPEWKRYVNADGSMYVLITGGLYGLPQAALLWHEHLKATLVSIGYAPSDADPSTFVKLRGGNRSILVIHVDDILHVTDMPGAQQLLLKTLTEKYGVPTVQSGDSGIYIGLEYQFNRPDKSVRITMTKQVEKVLSQFAIVKGSRTPAGVNFLEIDPDSPRVSPTEFASRVMSLYYLVSRVRPDLLFCVSFMATRINECNEADAKKVQRIFQYLFATRDRGIVIKPNGFRLVFAIDASYNILPRARSQSGLHVTLCQLPSDYDLDTSFETSEYGPIIFRSTKQKLVATSSFEAELNAVHEYRDLVLLLRLLMSEFGFNQDEPSVILQDNGATLLTLRRGRVFHGRSQAIDMRYFKQHEYQVDGIVVFGRSSSDDIAADPLTKPMVSSKDQGKLARICNDGGV